MPRVGKKHFKYDGAGRRAAASYKKKRDDKMRKKKPTNRKA